MKRRATQSSLACLLLSTLVACEVPLVGSPHHIVGSTLQPDHNKEEACGETVESDVCQQARANREELRWYRDNEWVHNGTRRGDETAKHKAPLVCVSFSGGGIRSAAFSIGVMKGLFEKPVVGGTSLLKYVDVLSGTSGGAYALSWYYMQRITQVRADEELFDNAGAIQRHLKENAAFLTALDYGTSGISNVILLSPLNFLLNGVLGTHTNTSFAHYIYRGDIKNTFHAGQVAELPQLHPVIQDNQLPYFIITTTSRVDENHFHHDSLLRNTVFEFTPLRIGNDGFGYTNSADVRLKDIADIVSIAGAAPDSSQVVSGSAQRFFASWANADYGRYILNYNDTRHPFRWFLTKLMPFPFYFFTESYNHDMRGSEIYLSDGGHQENLAVYPLIRRQCQNIIIVDGEYDPNYEFESYFKVKHSVERELRVTMELQPTELCRRSKRSNCRENDVDRIETELRDNAEFPGTRGEAEARRTGIPMCCFSGQHPVMHGRIKYFPVLTDDDSLVQWHQINLIYMKLSIDSELFKGWETLGEDDKQHVTERVGAKAADYYGKSLRDKCEVRYWNACAFPQFSTSHQSFTPEQLEAYVDLGATMVKQHLTAAFTDKTLTLTPK